jgi:sugar lactone lactonase YvrE
MLVAALLALAAPARAYVPEVLIPAGPFHGVHGLAFGTKGELYAADIMGLTVHRIDVATGRHRPEVGPPLGMADDVAVAPAGTPHAGTLVWTSIAVGRLYAKSPGGEPRVVADNLTSINTVGFHPDRRLFGTQMGGPNALWQFDLSGKGKHRKVWDDTGRLNGFVIAPDGFLYGPRTDTRSVIRLDLATLEVKTIAEGFGWPVGVKMDRNGVLYVADLDTGTVTRLEKDTGAKEVLATLAPGLDNLAIGPDGLIYASSPTQNGVFAIDPATKSVRAVARGRLTAPGGVAVLEDGAKPRLFVADLFSLREVDTATGADRVIAPAGDASMYPATVSAHRDGGGAPRLIVTSFYTGLLAIIDPDSGEFLRREGGFTAPRDAVHLGDGTILVAETGAKRLTVLGADGSRVPLALTLQEPVGLARGADGTVYVTDATTGTLHTIDVASARTTGIASGFGRPEGVAVMADGRALVVDSLKGRLVRVDSATGEQVRIADQIAIGIEPPAPQPAVWIHNGVAADAAGNIYLPSDKQTALYRLAPNPTRSIFRKSPENE